MNQSIIVLQQDELSALVSEAVFKGIRLADKSIPKKENMNETEAGDYLGISPVTLRLMRSQGRGPSYSKLGNSVRYNIKDLNTYREKNKVLTHG